MSTSTNLREVTQLAGEDRRAARLLAAAEADARRAEQDRAAADAAAERELRLASGRVDIDAKRRAARRTEQGEIDAQRRAQRAARRSERRAQAAARRAWVGARIAYARRNAPAVYSAGIYGLAVAGAVYGQITAATGRGWPLLVGLVVAAALEGLALSMALTAHQLRLAGERAMAPRALTWVAALAASAINYFGHADADPTGAIVLAALSLVGIIVWEIRSGAKHRTALREAGMIPDPPARFGWRRWVRFPAGTLAAWSRDVRDRVSPQAADVLAAMAVERAERARTARARQVARMARDELAAARKRGDGPAVVAALVRLAEVDGPDRAAGPAPDRTAINDGGPADRTALPGPVRLGAADPADRTGDADRWAHALPGPVGLNGTAPALTSGNTDASRAGARAREGASEQAPQRASERAAERATVRPVDRASGSAGGRSSDRGPDRAVRDVSALLPAGQTVRDRLAADGRPLTRSALIAGLREAGHTVSTDRASALLAALNTTDLPPATQPA
jgi:hypothetical protein